MPLHSDNAPDAASFAGRERLTDEQLDKLRYGRVIYGNVRKNGQPVKEPHYAIILNKNDDIEKIQSRANPVYQVICISHSEESGFRIDPPSRTLLTGHIQGEWQSDIEEAGILKLGPALTANEMILIQALMERVIAAKKSTQ